MNDERARLLTTMPGLGYFSSNISQEKENLGLKPFLIKDGGRGRIGSSGMGFLVVLMG